MRNRILIGSHILPGICLRQAIEFPAMADKLQAVLPEDTADVPCKSLGHKGPETTTIQMRYHQSIIHCRNPDSNSEVYYDSFFGRMTT